MEKPSKRAWNPLDWQSLQQAFAQVPSITRRQVQAHFQRTEPALSPDTLDSRIHELLRRGQLISVGRGRYAFEATGRPVFRPPMTRSERIIWKELAAFNLPAGCLWATAWVHELMIHQPARSLLLVEVPKDYTRAVFHALQDRYGLRVFLQPTPDVLTRYVTEANRPLVVQPFVSRAPVQLAQHVPVPTLEKLLVDLFCEPDLFYTYQGQELKTIFTNADRTYQLDSKRLLSYAGRRGRASALRQFLQQLGGWSSLLDL